MPAVYRGAEKDPIASAEVVEEREAREAADALLATEADLQEHLADDGNPHGVTKAQVGLGSVDDTSDADKPLSDAAVAELAIKADLVAGKVPTSQIPAIATGQTFSVASQAAMLALTTAQVQPGDVAIRTDLSGRRFLLANPDPSVLGNWIALETPDAVSSVQGQQGAVVLGAHDVGAPTQGELTAHTGDHANPHAVTKAQVGLGNVSDLAPADMPVSTAVATVVGTEVTARQTADADLAAQLLSVETSQVTQDTAIALRAPLASPALTGTPTAPTPSVGDVTTKIATMAAVGAEVALDRASIATLTAALAAVTVSTKSASYTLALVDAGTVIDVSSASNLVVTVPPNSTVAFPVGSIIELGRLGTGTVSVAAGAGVTVSSADGFLKLRVQFSTASLRKTATNTWLLVGDLSA